MSQILIKKSYFDNIKTSIESINAFFSSQFKTKNFPIIDSEYVIQPTILKIMTWLNDVDPKMIEDVSVVDDLITKINDAVGSSDDNSEDVENEETAESPYSKFLAEDDTKVLDLVNTFIGYKILQFISENFDDFSKLMNGIYTFDMFLHPSNYTPVIGKFSKPLDLEEISSMVKNEEFSIFDIKEYVTSIFDSEEITLPAEMNIDNEINRMTSSLDIKLSSKKSPDLDGVEVVVDDRSEEDIESSKAEVKQEQAEVNLFVNKAPDHIKYDIKRDIFLISKQLQKDINDFLSGLEKCNDTSDLITYFGETIPKQEYGTMFGRAVIPFILTKVFNNGNKYPSTTTHEIDVLQPYITSYESIKAKNTGAVRFYNYDMFSTFKIDKEGTIKFLRGFLTLDLVNNEKAVIENNTLCTIFNIYDSRIYLDTLYNLIPEKIKQEKYPTEDGFVKGVRGRINKNSHSIKIYDDTQGDVPDDNSVKTSKQITEYSFKTLKSMGDITLEDMQYCDQYSQILHDEIKTMNDKMYNEGYSQIAVDKFIGESYNIFQEGLFSKMKEKKKQKKLEQNISRIENSVGVKFHEDFKKSQSDDSFDGYPFSIIPIDDNYTKKYVKDGKYQVGSTYMDYDKANGTYVQSPSVWMDEEGVVYTDLYSKNRKTMEKMTGTFQEFLSNLKSKKVPLLPGENKQKVNVSYYDDEDEERSFNVNFELKAEKECDLFSLSEFLGEIDSFNSSDSFGELVRYTIAKKHNGFTDVKFKMKSIVFTPKTDTECSYTILYVYEGKEYDFTTVCKVSDGKCNYIQEMEMGDIPDYMKNRINVSDENKPDTISVTDVNIPPTTPVNPIDDLANSIDAKLNAAKDSDDINEMIGSEAKGNSDAKVIYNITFNNSFNKTNSDSSTGKTINNTNSHNKNINTKENEGNNNNNNGSIPVEDTKVDNLSKQSFSNGKTFEEMMTILEAEEPLSDTIPDTDISNQAPTNAGDLPKPDMMTRAMDADRESLALQQKAKHAVQKVYNTGRAILKPIGRAKKWMTDMVDSLIKRDEDKVKAEIIENPSYRTSLYKACRLALKFGLTSIAFTISGYLGAAVVAGEVGKAMDKQRLRKEVQAEFGTEIAILDDKIRKANEDNTPESRKAKWQMTRLRNKMVQIAAGTPKHTIKSTSEIL